MKSHDIPQITLSQDTGAQDAHVDFSDENMTMEELVENSVANDNSTEEYEYQSKEEYKAMVFLVKSLYQIQKLRIGLGNRIYAHCALNLGIKPSTKKDEAKQASKLLKELETEYKNITTALSNTIFSDELRTKLRRKKIDADAIAVSMPQSILISDPTKINVAIDTVEETAKEIGGDLALLVKSFNKGIINNVSEFAMARTWITLRQLETDISKELGNIVDKFDIWNYFFRPLKGIGPVLASCLISTVNMHKCVTVQSLWKYCGLDVVLSSDDPTHGEGRSNKKEHMVIKPYIDKDGVQRTKLSLTYNPWLKSKLIGVAAECLIKANPEYLVIYHDVKHRLEESDRVTRMRPRIKNGKPVLNDNGEMDMIREYPPSRLTAMAKRYMIKMFLLDYWVHGRCLLGETLKTPWVMEKLGYQCKFRTFVGGPENFVRVAYHPGMNLEMLRIIQKGPISAVRI